MTTSGSCPSIVSAASRSTAAYFSISTSLTTPVAYYTAATVGGRWRRHSARGRVSSRFDVVVIRDPSTTIMTRENGTRAFEMRSGNGYEWFVRNAFSAATTRRPDVKRNNRHDVCRKNLGVIKRQQQCCETNYMKITTISCLSILDNTVVAIKRRSQGMPE